MPRRQHAPETICQVDNFPPGDNISRETLCPEGNAPWETMCLWKNVSHKICAQGVNVPQDYAYYFANFHPAQRLIKVRMG